MSSAEGQVKGCCPVRWLDHGRQVIVALPEHVNVSTASPIREQLLTIINGSRVRRCGTTSSTPG